LLILAEEEKRAIRLLEDLAKDIVVKPELIIRKSI
jgi:hypothetical protein